MTDSTEIRCDGAHEAHVTLAAIEPVASSPVELLQFHVRRRQDAVLAEGNITRQIDRIVCRLIGETKCTNADIERYDTPGGPFAALVEARKSVRAWRRTEEKLIVAYVKQLPAFAAFWEPINGLGALGLGLIVGEAGDLSNYANPAKLWKRFGLHVHSDGRAYSKSMKGLTAEDWTAAGYSPRRRSMMFTIGDSLLKKQNPYKEMYNARKAAEVLKLPESAGGTKMRWHRRAQRYVEKRVLRDLWCSWCGRICVDTLAWDAAS